MVNVKKLKEKMREKGWNVEKLSKVIGIDKSTFYRKLNNNGLEFTVKEVDMIAKNLKLTYDEVNDIFFSQFVAYKRLKANI